MRAAALLAIALLAAPVFAEEPAPGDYKPRLETAEKLELTGRVARPAPKKQRIAGLNWEAEKADTPVYWDKQAKGSVPFLKLVGKLEGSDASVLYQTVLKPDEEGRFSILVAIKSRSTPFEIMEVTPLGEMRVETFRATVTRKAWEKLEKERKKKEEEEKEKKKNEEEEEKKKEEPKKEEEPPAEEQSERPIPRHQSYVSLGPTLAIYEQTRVREFTQTALTLKASHLFSFKPPVWDVGASGFVTLLPLKSSGAGNKFRSLGLNARVGYTFQGIKAPWRLSLLGGAYFTSMLVSEGNFGFKNLAGPQVFPSVARSFRNGNVGTLYLKYSPISDGTRLLSLQSCEIAGGLGYILMPKPGKTHPWSINFDVSRLIFEKSGSVFSLMTFNLSAGYGF